ncbi:MAG TPA: hypothetical protein ENN80_09605, partial [Candidatus Hydrogenedentes bacterium]|nr:hypothetical protein [Candidatus Hydrogenedentota bacterium]
MTNEYHIEDEVHDRPVDLRILHRLLGYVRPYRLLLVAATLLLLAATAISTGLPILNMHAIDH